MKSKRAREVVETEEKVRVEDEAAPAKKRKRDLEEAEVPATNGDVKKAKKDKTKKKHEKESRKEKKAKRKDLLDLPEQDGDKQDLANGDKAGEEVAEEDLTKEKEEKKSKKDKKDKKDKKKKDKNEKKDTEADVPDPASHEAKANPTPTTKSPIIVPVTNGKSKSKSQSQSQSNGDDNGNDNERNNSNPIDLPSDAESESQQPKEKQDRHIVFIGNLPFSATAASISAHFASLSPVAVRCMRNKDDPNPCRGIAFVEFGKVWQMRTCLDKFHHSMFDDGVSPARKINIELT